MPQREPHAQTDLICIIALPISISHRPAQIGGSARGYLAHYYAERSGYPSGGVRNPV